MKRLLAAVVFALALTSSCSAQNAPKPPVADPTMEQLLAARANLIHRYVQSEKVARGVAVCGSVDLLTGEERSYLCLYVYRDSVKDFIDDFVNFATPTGVGGNLGVDGIPVSVQLIGPAKMIEKETPPNGKLGTPAPRKI